MSNWKLAIQTEDRPWQLTNLGVLLFCDQPERFLAGAYVDIAVYAHGTPDGNTVDAKRITGTAPEQIEKTLEYMLASPYVAIRSTKSGMGRLDEPRYSPVALQESIVNAIVHRDYELTGSQIIVYLFPDRIEVRNPGGLHNTLTPENLYAGCQPIRRNQHMAGFLRDFKSPRTGRAYMEMRGEGFDCTAGKPALVGTVARTEGRRTVGMADPLRRQRRNLWSISRWNWTPSTASPTAKIPC